MDEGDIRTFAVTKSKIRKGAVTEGKLSEDLQARINNLDASSFDGLRLIYLDGRDREVPLKNFNDWIFGPLGAILDLGDGIVLDVDILKACGNEQVRKWCLRPDQETDINDIYYAGVDCTGPAYIAADPQLQNGFIPPASFGRVVTNRTIEVYEPGQVASSPLQVSSVSTGGVRRGNEISAPWPIICSNEPTLLGDGGATYYPVTLGAVYNYTLPIRAEYSAE